MTSQQCLSGEPKESLKKFVFSMKNDARIDEEKLEIVIPEVGGIALAIDIVERRCFSFGREVAGSTNTRIEFINSIVSYLQLLEPGYSFYTWPSATVLAW